jgi:hypothetical protein
VELILAQAGSSTAPSVTGGFDPSTLLQYGLGGILAVAAIFGLIWFRPAVDRILKDKEAVEQQRDALVKLNTDQTIPAITGQAETNRRLTEVINEMVATLKQLVHEVQELRSDLAARGSRGGG